MWGFISWLLAMFFGIKGNPIALAIIRAVGATMASVPPGAIARAFVLVNEAAERDDLTSTEKFAYVYDSIQTEYPSLKENTIGVLIKSCLDAVKQGFI